MTHEQFHRRLLKLLREARHAGLCPACVTLELAAAAAAIVELAHVTPDPLVPLQRRRQLHSSAGSVSLQRPFYFHFSAGQSSASASALPHFSARSAPLQRSFCFTSAFVLAPPQRLDSAQFLSIFAASMGDLHRGP